MQLGQDVSGCGRGQDVSGCGRGHDVSGCGREGGCLEQDVWAWQGSVSRAGVSRREWAVWEGTKCKWAWQGRGVSGARCVGVAGKGV